MLHNHEFLCPAGTTYGTALSTFLLMTILINLRGLMPQSAGAYYLHPMIHTPPGYVWMLGMQ